MPTDSRSGSGTGWRSRSLADPARPGGPRPTPEWPGHASKNGPINATVGRSRRSGTAFDRPSPADAAVRRPVVPRDSSFTPSSEHYLQRTRRTISKRRQRIDQSEGSRTAPEGSRFCPCSPAPRSDAPHTADNSHDAIFASRRGTWLSPQNVRRQRRQARTDTGLEWVTPHSFRKTVASLIDKEASAKNAAAQLGHESEEITKKHYIVKPAVAPDSSDILEKLGPDQAASSTDASGQGQNRAA
jgi:hypothetical protein